MLGMVILDTGAASAGALGLDNRLATCCGSQNREARDSKQLDTYMHCQVCMYSWLVQTIFLPYQLRVLILTGAAQESTGASADVMLTYRSGLLYLSKNNPVIENSVEYRMWAELLLTRSCMLSSKFSQPSAKAQGPLLDPEASLESFREWLEFWQSDPARASSLKHDIYIGKTFNRRAVWQAYYKLLSQFLDEGYTYPGTSAEKETGRVTNRGFESGTQSSPRFRQSTEIWRVGAIYEGFLLKEVPFPEATEINSEVLSWVDRAMSNWSILCGSEWMDQDLGKGGQVAACRNVLDVRISKTSWPELYETRRTRTDSF